MGLLTSLLCCGNDANDSADDKFRQVPNRVSLKEHINPTSSKTTSGPKLTSANSTPNKTGTSTTTSTAKTTTKGSSSKRNSRALGGKPEAVSGSASKGEVRNKDESIFSDSNQLHNDSNEQGSGTDVAVAAAVAAVANALPNTSSDDKTKENTSGGSEKVKSKTPVQSMDQTNQSSAVIRDDSWMNDEDEIKRGLDDSSLDDDDDDEVEVNADADANANVDNNNDNIDDASADADMSTQVNDDLYEKGVDYDEDGPIDLTKIQKGQAFHPDTGMLLGKKDVARFGNKKCLILDLDETLVHSSFKYLRTADFVIPVEIDNQVHHVYVIKRPGVDEFLKKVGQWYEVVVFTASVAKYGDPLLNKLDIHNAVHHRLFRDSCYSYQGNFIKNLSQIGRPLEDSIIIDNSPASYIFHPQHSVPISSWFSDTHDNELLDLLPLLEDLSKPNVDDVSLVLDISI